MNRKIHFDTIQRYFILKYKTDIDQNEFVNNKTGEIYNVIFKKGTDIAVFSARENNSYICIDSNGEVIEKDNIIGYVNGINVAKDENGVIFSEKDLALECGNEVAEVAQLVNIENILYPERTSIVLDISLQERIPLHNMMPFYVDDVVYVGNDEFDEIINSRPSQILIDYNSRKYKTVANANHGLIIINEDGNGVVVDTQGYDYARYIAYTPLIESEISKRLEIDMEQKAVYEMKLYVPIRIVERDVEYGERYDIDGSIYLDKIRDSIRNDDVHEQKRGFAAYFKDNKIKQNKVYSIKPDVERVNDVMMGVVAIKMTEPLNQAEIDELKDYMTSQFSNGWGSSFEQQAIQTDGKEIYVHFWNKEEYFIKTDQEMESEQNQDIEMEGMQGIQGMQMY